MSALLQKMNEAANFIQSRFSGKISIGLILGSGLGNFIKEMEVKVEIPYSEIPHFPVSTVVGHSGKLIIGALEGKLVVAMAGRFHFYEGYSPEEVVFPVRVMKQLGVETLLLSNAAGGVNSHFKVGDLMIINDHISFATVNPLIGKNETCLGPRFPDMSEPYSKDLIAKAKAIAKTLGFHVHEGVYFGVTGPTFETRAEYRMIKIVGADVVGMSTVQETIVAVHMGMSVFGMSVVTDLGIRDDENVITHEEVLEAAATAEPRFSAIFKELVKAI